MANKDHNHYKCTSRHHKKPHRIQNTTTTATTATTATPQTTTATTTTTRRLRTLDSLNASRAGLGRCVELPSTWLLRSSSARWVLWCGCADGCGRVWVYGWMDWCGCLDGCGWMGVVWLEGEWVLVWCEEVRIANKGG